MRALLALLAACGAASVGASTPSSQALPPTTADASARTTRLGLNQVLQAAREHPDVLAASRQVNAARADVLAADRAPAPTLSSSLSTVDLRHTPQSGSAMNPGRLDKSVGLDWQWERGGKRGLRTDKAQTLVQAAEADRQEALVLQSMGAQMAFYDLLTAHQRLAVFRELAQSAEQLAQSAQMRWLRGDVSAQEAARTRIEAQRAQADVQTARLEYQQASAGLTLWTGLTEPADGWALEVRWPPRRAGEGVNDAERAPGPWLEARSDVTAARLRLSAAQQSVALAQALRVTDPVVGTSLENTPDGFGNSAKTMAVRIAIPLVGANRFDGEIGRALAEQAVSQDLLERTRQRALNERVLLLQAKAANAARLQTYEEKIVPDALRVAEQTEAAYRQGGLPLTELLDARRTLRAVQLDVLSAQGAYAKAWMNWQLRLSPNTTP